LKKIIYFSLLILGVLVLGGCNLLGQGQPAGVGENQTDQQQATNQGEGFVGKLKDAIALGTAMECTFSKDDYSGTTWVKGKQIYSEFTQPDNNGFMIMQGDCIYTWGSAQPQGIKMCYDPSEFEAMTEQSQDLSQGQAGPPPDMEYNCSPAVVNDSMFNPPADIEFMDINQLMNPGN